jgi:hypothetical protein
VTLIRNSSKLNASMEALINALIDKGNKAFLRKMGYHSYNAREVSFRIQDVSREILDLGRGRRSSYSYRCLAMTS